MNGKAPLYLTLLAAAVLVAALFLFQPYSADFPGSAYAKPARRYIRAAQRQDSAALARLSLSPRPVRWALDAARHRPDSLAAWSGRIEAWIAERRGDTTEVLVYGTTRHCENAPIVLRFVGSAGRAKVAGAESKCLDTDPPR